MKHNSRNIVTISLLSIPLSAGVALVPVLSNIAAAFPNQKESMQLLLTMPSLFMMFSSLLTNTFAQKSSLKLIVIISISMIAFAGLSPYWIIGFTYLLFSRGLMGIGLGLLHTAIVSLPALYFNDSQTRDHAVGIQSAFVCAGAILFHLLSGILAKYNWRYVFLVQFLNVIPLLAAIFLMPKTANDRKTESKHQRIFVKHAIPIVGITFIGIVLTCTYPLNLSLFVEKQGLGDSQFVGLLTSINSAIGFFIGLIFGKVYAKVREYTLSLGFILSAVALLIVAFLPNPAMLLLGSICFGIGTSFISPSLYSILYKRVKPEEVVSSVAMLAIAGNVSQFISPFVINPIAKIIDGTSAEGTRFVVAGAAIFLLAIFLYWQNHKKAGI